jgi:hypothetical protein
MIHQRDKNERVLALIISGTQPRPTLGEAAPRLAQGRGMPQNAHREQNAAAPSTRWTHPLCTFRVHRGGHRKGEGDAHLNTLQKAKE